MNHFKRKSLFEGSVFFGAPNIKYIGVRVYSSITVKRINGGTSLGGGDHAHSENKTPKGRRDTESTATLLFFRRPNLTSTRN